MSETGYLAKIREISDVINDVNNIASAKSIIDVAKPTLVEPVTLIDQSLTASPILTSVLNSLITQYASFYTLAAQVYLNTDRLEVLNRLEPLNPSRSLTGPIVNNGKSLNKYKGILIDSVLSMENLSAQHILSGEASGNIDSNWGDDAIYKVDNYSVGKRVKLTLSAKESDEDSTGTNNNKLPIVINVRALSMVVKTRLLVDIILNKAEDVTLSSRWTKMRGHEITFTDFLLGTDVLRRRKRLKAADDSNVLEVMDDRRRKGYLSSVLTGKVSLNIISVIMVFSAETIEEFERREGFAFTNDRKREALLDKLSTMILAVVDTSYETVTFYYKSTPGYNKVTFNQIDTAEKKVAGGADITSMMRALNEGQRPKLI